jgi:hypothetical protein
VATFTPPVNEGEVANSTPRDEPLIQRAMSHFARVDRGRNVYILDGITVTEADPIATYDSQGTVVLSPNERITRFFQGGATHEVNEAETLLLEAAGYTVDP